MTDTNQQSRGLVFLGMVIDLEQIPNAENLLKATVVCGKGGKWVSPVRKEDFKIGDKCNVYLPDSIVPPTEDFEFMRKYHFRVRPMRFRGCPSECLIMPYEYGAIVGDDVTSEAGVTKYEKTIPACMAGTVLGKFPAFIPKTDEQNFQAVPHILEYMTGRRYYATEKVDGTSCTVYYKNGHFGVCSRNLELVEDDNNVYWKVAKRYNLQEKLPRMGEYAIQMEIVGPGIQGNPMGLRGCEARVFDVINLTENRYFNWLDLDKFCIDLEITPVSLICYGMPFMMNHDQLQAFVESKVYENGTPVEGVVFRTIEPEWLLNNRASFKVLNLLYKEKNERE
jgi:RNA ligase (TIGR02306 family)